MPLHAVHTHGLPVPLDPLKLADSWWPQHFHARAQLRSLSAFLEEEVENALEAGEIDLLIVDFLTFSGMELADKHSVPSIGFLPAFSVAGVMNGISMAPLPMFFGTELPDYLFRNRHFLLAAPKQQPLESIHKYVPEERLTHVVPLLRKVSSPMSATDPVFDGDLQEWLEFDDWRPILYVSFGTMVELTPQQVVTLAEAFTQQREQYRVLWQLEERERYGFIGAGKDMRYPVSAGLYVTSHVPQQELLLLKRQSEAVKETIVSRVQFFLSHAGANSVLEAVRARVPLVLAPQAMDQCNNAKLAKEKGLGVMLCECGETMYVEDVMDALTRVQEEHANIQAAMDTFAELEVSFDAWASPLRHLVETVLEEGCIAKPPGAGSSMKFMGERGNPTAMLVSSVMVVLVPLALAFRGKKPGPTAPTPAATASGRSKKKAKVKKT